MLRTVSWTLATALAATALTGCGGSGSHRFGTVTDCSRIGPVTQVDDPAGDQRGRAAGTRGEPQGDLAGLRLARGGGRLCAEFRTRGDIHPFAAFLLVLHPRSADTPVVQLQAAVLSGQLPTAMLASGERGFRHVDAKVGIDGSRLTVLIGRREFSRLGAAGVFDAFRYQARSAVVTADDKRLTDCMPSCG